MQFQRLDHLMKNMERFEREGATGEVKKCNLKIIALDFFHMVNHTFQTAVLIPALPFTTLVSATASTIGGISRLRRLDQPNAASARKLSQKISKFIKKIPSPVDVLHVIVKIAKFAIALFAAMTVGFISVKANIWIHHKLGLICNPMLAKNERKMSVIKAAKKREGCLLKKQYHQKIEQEIYTRTESTLRSKTMDSMVGDLENEGESGEEKDPVTSIQNVIERATQEKRQLAKAASEIKLQRELTNDEIDLIKIKYWKNLSDPFAIDFDQPLSEELRDFLSDIFYWEDRQAHSTLIYSPGFNFKSSKHYEKYLENYYEWNLTPAEAESALATMAFPKDERNALESDVKKALYKERRLKTLETIKREFYSQALEKRMTDEIAQNSNGASKNEIISYIKALVQVENLILKQTLNNEPLGIIQINEIIDNQEYVFSVNDRAQLQDFAQNAVEEIDKRRQEIIKELKRRLKYFRTQKDMLPVEHFYELKTLAMNQLTREYIQKLPSYPNDFQVIEEVLKEMIDHEVALKEEHAKNLSQLPEQEKELITLTPKEISLIQQHYEKVEKPRLMEQYQLKEMFPGLEKIEEERTRAFKALFTDPAGNLIESGNTRLIESYCENDGGDRFIVKDEQHLNNKSWAHTVLDYSISAEGQAKIRFNDSYDSQVEMTFEELDVLVEKKKQWFKAAAKVYNSHKADIAHSYLYEQTVPVKVKGVYGYFDEQYNKHWSVQEEAENTLLASYAETLDYLIDQNRKLREENLNLKLFQMEGIEEEIDDPMDED